MYSFLREDGISPYYIGKGKGNRAWRRQKYDVKAPPQDRICILRDGMEEEEALELERLLILMWGRKVEGGLLQNVKEGGDNPPNHTGMKRSNETKKKMSISQKKRWSDPLHKAEMCAKMKENWSRTPERLNKLKTQNLGRKLSPEHLTKLRDGYKKWSESK